MVEEIYRYFKKQKLSQLKNTLLQINVPHSKPAEAKVSSETIVLKYNSHYTARMGECYIFLFYNTGLLFICVNMMLIRYLPCCSRGSGPSASGPSGWDGSSQRWSKCGRDGHPVGKVQLMCEPSGLLSISCKQLVEKIKTSFVSKYRATASFWLVQL